MACNGETFVFLLVLDKDMNNVLLIVTDIVLDVAELFALLFTLEEDDSSWSSAALQHESESSSLLICNVA